MPNIRYVVTHTDKEGARVLTFQACGRYTYSSKEEAQKALDLFKPELVSRSVVLDGETLEVRPVPCWPVHNDPQHTVFSEE